jgi:hypothetical protein
MGATTGSGTAYPSGTPEFTPGFQKNLNQARELNESTYTGLEDRNHEETGYREIVASDSNPNIANADVNYHVP